MARTNKYTSINFNDIYEKKFTNNKTSSSSSAPFQSSANNGDHKKPMLSNSRIQGHMLVLTRPTPKPISIPVPAPIPQKQQEKQTLSSTPADQTRSEPDLISLRPQGRTGSGPSVGSSPLTSSGGPISPSPSTSAVKLSKFVPPHLRPGFVGREEKPGPESGKGGGPGGPGGPGGKGVGLGRGNFGSPNRYGEDGRPKSGGGYERMRRGGGGGFVGGVVDPADIMNRPGSMGDHRPSTSG